MIRFLENELEKSSECVYFYPMLYNQFLLCEGFSNEKHIHRLYCELTIKINEIYKYIIVKFQLFLLLQLRDTIKKLVSSSSSSWQTLERGGIPVSLSEKFTCSPHVNENWREISVDSCLLYNRERILEKCMFKAICRDINYISRLYHVGKLPLKPYES